MIEKRRQELSRGAGMLFGMRRDFFEGLMSRVERRGVSRLTEAKCTSPPFASIRALEHSVFDDRQQTAPTERQNPIRILGPEELEQRRRPKGQEGSNVVPHSRRQSERRPLFRSSSEVAAIFTKGRGQRRCREVFQGGVEAQAVIATSRDHSRLEELSSIGAGNEKQPSIEIVSQKTRFWALSPQATDPMKRVRRE
jgi:hypothetical protein